MYVIWSHEHRMWWRAKSQGYTPTLDEAGRYSMEEAARVTLEVMPPGQEIAMRESVAHQFCPKGFDANRRIIE